MKRDKGTCVCTAFVLEKQGLVTFAFSFTNFDKPDRFPVRQGGTEILMHQVKPIWAKGPICRELSPRAGGHVACPNVEKHQGHSWLLGPLTLTWGTQIRSNSTRATFLPPGGVQRLSVSLLWRVVILFILLERRGQGAFSIARRDLRLHQAFSCLWVGLNCSLYFAKLGLAFSSVQMSKFSHMACNTSNGENTSSRDASKPKPWTGVTEKGGTMTCREERCTVTMAGCNLPGMQTAREGVGSSGLEVLGCGLKCAKG